MAVSGDTHNLVVDVPLESLCVVRNLDKSALRKTYAGVFAEKRRVVGGGLITLNMPLLGPVEKPEELGGLLSGAHVVI